MMKNRIAGRSPLVTTRFARPPPFPQKIVGAPPRFFGNSYRPKLKPPKSRFSLFGVECRVLLLGAEQSGFPAFFGQGKPRHASPLPLIPSPFFFSLPRKFHREKQPIHDSFGLIVSSLCLKRESARGILFCRRKSKPKISLKAYNFEIFVAIL
ncbi:MAG: hypothetical protein LBG61_01525 [Burkholderiales bacterium]|jgi:hypothetical protein|nr:hypothetical protein [Burkholderiales bacterium]